MYSTINRGKFVVVERFIGTLKIKIYKDMAAVSKNVYIDKVDEIVYKYNKTYQRATKMKPTNVNQGTYIDYGIRNNDKDAKFKVGDCGRIPKYKNIYLKDYTPNWSKEVFVIKKEKILNHKHTLSAILTIKRLLECSMEKCSQKQGKKNSGFKK